MKRKADIREGKKLPPLRRTAPVSISDLIDLALEYVKVHQHKDQRTYKSRGEIIRKSLGGQNAEAFTSQEIETWLAQNTKTPATFNRYKALISLAYKLGIRNKKLTHNPARGEFIPMRKEPKGRLRFLSREEYDNLYKVVAERFPEHLAEFVTAVHTGMRLSGQYTVQVVQVDRNRRVIDLDKSKNGDSRTVHLNADALAAVESVLHPGRKRSERLFPREDHTAIYPNRKQESFDNRSWFAPAVEQAEIPRITCTGYVIHFATGLLWPARQPARSWRPRDIRR